MIVQYCSDLHLERQLNSKHVEENPLAPEGDVLLLAGDILHLTDGWPYHPFLDKVSRQYRMVFLLPGNHEFYGGLDLRFADRPHKQFVRPNVMLVNNTTVVYRQTTFVFSTLWSHISAQHRVLVEQQVADFKYIRYQGMPLTVPVYNQLFRQSCKFLEQAADRRETGKMVVVTHHLPSWQCNAEEFRGSPLNEAFSSELHDFIYASGPDYWVYGHSHRNMPPVQINGTTLLTNQLGDVASHEFKGFTSAATFDLQRTHV